MILVSNDYYNGTRTPEYLSFCGLGLDSHVATWFAGDEQMGGDCHGYDGPCPPWNNRAVLHYLVTCMHWILGDCQFQEDSVDKTSCKRWMNTYRKHLRY